MAIEHRAIVISEWMLRGINRLSMLADDRLAGGMSVSDITGQQPNAGGEARTSPNALLVLGDEIIDAAWNILEVDVRFYVMARQSWDTSDPETLIFNNFNEVLNQTQVDDMVADIQTRFTDIAIEDLAAIQRNKTRLIVVRDLVTDWKEFSKIT